MENDRDNVPDNSAQEVQARLDELERAGASLSKIDATLAAYFELRRRETYGYINKLARRKWCRTEAMLADAREELDYARDHFEYIRDVRDGSHFGDRSELAEADCDLVRAALVYDWVIHHWRPKKTRIKPKTATRNGVKYPVKD